MVPVLVEQLRQIRIAFFDFDGVFTDNTVYVTQDGVESVRCWRSDGLGLERLRSVGVDIVIMSTETNAVVSARARKLRVECKQGLQDKAAAVQSICSERSLDTSSALFVGNDINDIPAFKVVGLPIAVSDASEEVLAWVAARTICAGGRGAVREVCDDVYFAKSVALNADHRSV